MFHIQSNKLNHSQDMPALIASCQVIRIVRDKSTKIFRTMKPL